MKNVKKWISFMLIAQRYADLPNSAIMYELEAEPAIVFHADGTSKVVALRKLDAKAKLPATIFTYTFGIITAR